MRLCPSVEGSASPLITHRIGVDVCQARQRAFFHKCHRCIYRGKALNWEPEESPLAMIDVHAEAEPPPVAQKRVKAPKVVELQPAPARKKGRTATTVAKGADVAS